MMKDSYIKDPKNIIDYINITNLIMKKFPGSFRYHLKNKKEEIKGIRIISKEKQNKTIAYAYKQRKTIILETTQNADKEEVEKLKEIIESMKKFPSIKNNKLEAVLLNSQLSLP